MKKLLTIVALCSLALLLQGQSLFNNYGEWVYDTTITTKWIVYDTIRYNPSGDTTWVYSDWELCGWGMSPDRTKCQYRISEKGIQEERMRHILYHYIPPAISDYEKKMNEIRKKK